MAPDTRPDDLDIEAAPSSAPHKNTDDARQGTTGHNVRYVLIWSTIGALIVLVAAWVFVNH